MISSCIDLDTHKERSITFDYPNYPKYNDKCDYQEKFYNTRDLVAAFTSVLVHLCINYVLKCLLDLDLTLEDEKKLIDIVYRYVSDLMYKFWDKNYCFFQNLFLLFPLEYYKSHCFSISKN